VLAMLILDPFKDGELAPGAQVHFKETNAVDDVTVDALGITSGLIQARLPAALENIARIAAVRNPLAAARGARDQKDKGAYGACEAERSKCGNAHRTPLREQVSSSGE